MVETNLEDKMFAASDCSWDFRLDTEIKDSIKGAGNVVACLLGTLVPFIRDAADWI